MPRLEPFRGLRYDPKSVRLDQVIAPPYDVIGPAERTRLASRHSANSVLVELPEPDLRAGLDRYAVAADLLARWRADGVLRLEEAPALYPYRMTAPDGRTSTGVIGALALAPPGEESGILPHEETLPKPRSDRLDLLRATGCNLSPIWGLSMTAGLAATYAPEGEPAGDAYDDDGVRHQVWVMTDPAAVAAVTEAVAASPVIIADGHHRYETARNFQGERRAAGAGDGGHDLVMALVVELSEDQLMVGPIHRTLAGLPEGFDLPGALAPWFDVVRAGPADARTVGALGGSLALVTRSDAYLLTPRDGAYEAAGSDLDSSLVALALADLPEHEATHRHTVDEAWEAVAGGEAQAAFLLRPVTVAQIEAWAGARRRMPPKSTYFWPKPRTGIVFRSLDDG